MPFDPLRLNQVFTNHQWCTEYWDIYCLWDHTYHLQELQLNLC